MITVTGHPGRDFVGAYKFIRVIAGEGYFEQ